MDVEKEINALEQFIDGVQGTILQRTLLPGRRVGWTLSLGRMQDPKKFFTGQTIQECVERAKKWAGG